MIPKRSLGIIIGVIAAAVLLIITSQAGIYKNIDGIMLLRPENNPMEQSKAYRINTECEIIYGLASGKYPDGEKLPQIKIDEMLAKYPQEFAPWRAILENNETRTEFFKQPLTAEFSDVLTTSVMKESAIKPELRPIASLIMDPQGGAKLEQFYQQYNCKPYFDERAGK